MTVTASVRHCIAVAFVVSLLAPAMGQAQVTGVEAAGKYKKRTFIEKGLSIDEISVPGKPPKDFRAPEAEVSAALGDVVLSNVPAFDWCYGCSATSAAMMMGYYDNGSHTNMYAGPANGGVCPPTNAVWGYGESPLSATHMGYDGRLTRGNVDDYWIEYGDAGPDPYISNGWPEHASADCTGDFMGTNQSKFGNVDGGTTFYFYTNGAPLYDYAGSSTVRDGCHGMRLFPESRGYTVTANFSQYIYGYSGNTLGFTFESYMAEIDAGRPVMIQVSGHSMVGFGYNPTDSVVYLRDTWDYGTHSMTWGGSYSGMEHYGVTVLQLAPAGGNLPPVANPQSVATDEDTSLAIILTGSDPDGDQITYSVATGPAHGTLSGAAPYLIYTPALNYYGTDSFTFTVDDGQATSAPATVTISIAAVNDPPAAAGDSYSVVSGKVLRVRSPGVLKNDSDPEKNPLTAAVVTPAANGTLVFQANGSFTYTPNAGFVGTDTFTYSASDGAATSAPATVTITVTKGRK